MGIQYQEYELLRKALLRDHWEAEEACLFFLGYWKLQNRVYNLKTGELLREGVGRRGGYSGSEPTEETKRRDEEYSDLLGRWGGADHNTKYQTKAFLWDKYYCLVWGEKNGVTGDLKNYVEWGLRQNLIAQEELENLKSQLEKKPTANQPISEKERNNRLRLIGVMVDILSDKDNKQRFHSESSLKRHIEENYTGTGLNERTLDTVFAEAKTLVEKKHRE